MSLIDQIKNTLFYLITKKTIGARILLVQDNKVLLIRHSYGAPGWYTVGGAVDPRETPLQAVLREAMEEVGATFKKEPKLFAVYYQLADKKRDDYIVFYIGTDFTLQDVHSSEIVEKRWFEFDKLPGNLSPATQRRIDEYLGKAAISDKW